MGQFTVSPGLASFCDDRPLVNVVVDIGEPLAVLTAGLVEISPDSMVDDTTVQYIGALLVDAVANPYPSPRNTSRVSAFFHPDYRPKVEELANTVKSIISDEIKAAERAAETEMHDSIYPAKDINTIQSRRGNLMTLSYRLGKESPIPGEDDPYLGCDPAVREIEEEADDAASEDIIHID